jgi:hypothetical protein
VDGIFFQRELDKHFSSRISRYAYQIIGFSMEKEEKMHPSFQPMKLDNPVEKIFLSFA